MEITRNLLVDGTFRPMAVNYLGQIPSTALFFVPHQLRHPESIYSLSLEKVGDAFLRVADGYFAKVEEYKRSDPSGLEMSDLLRYQESLLRALQEHLDDCYSILKTLVNPASAKGNSLFAEKYVIESRLPGAKTFKGAIEDYKRTLRIANKLKHQQGRLRGVAIWLPNSAHLGYFLEEPDAEGAVGPSPEIHPDQGAFSFARDLAWHLFNLYLCSEKLVTAVRSALNALYGTDLEFKIASPTTQWAQVVSTATRIPAALFPKEIQKHTARFRVDPSGKMLNIKCPTSVNVRFPTQVRTTCSTVGDGHSTNFKVPLP